MNRQIQDRVDFQLEANRVLSVASPARFDRMGVLTEEEMREADKACESGLTGEMFGRVIAARDRIAQAEKPVPIDFPKPLSPDDSTIIRLLTDMYVGIDQPLVKGETEDRVTLHVPRIKRVFKEVGAV